MTAVPNLKEIERRAFRSTYQDGLIDLQIGIIAASMTLMLSILDSDAFALLKLTLAFLGVGAGMALLWAGKKYLVLPRMGEAQFGPARRARTRRWSRVLLALIALQVLLVLLPTLALLVPSLGAAVAAWFPDQRMEALAVATVAALFVESGVTILSLATDFARGYYIALLMALGVFLAIWLGRPYFLLIAAGLIALPGLVLFVQFLRRYPRAPEPGQ